MRGIGPRTSCKLSERSTIWAASPLRKRGANAISNLSSVKAIVERSSFAYRSKIGFVDACHQSMCFSHANSLPFRLTCLTGGLHRSCSCQKDVFDSLIRRVMFPSTSFWGTPWRLAALIAFSASSVLFQMLPFAYSTYVSMSFFDLSNKLPVVNFFLIFGLLWKAGDAGHRSPFLSHAKRALYHLSYIPLRKWGANAISNLSSVNAIVERSSFAYHSKNGFVDAGHQSMRFSHANRLTYTLVGSKGAIYFIRRSLILFSVE